jgi:hypothetical protein
MKCFQTLQDQLASEARGMEREDVCFSRGEHSCPLKDILTFRAWLCRIRYSPSFLSLAMAYEDSGQFERP